MYPLPSSLIWILEFSSASRAIFHVKTATISNSQRLQAQRRERHQLCQHPYPTWWGIRPPFGPTLHFDRCRHHRTRGSCGQAKAVLENDLVGQHGMDECSVLIAVGLFLWTEGRDVPHDDGLELGQSVDILCDFESLLTLGGRKLLVTSMGVSDILREPLPGESSCCRMFRNSLTRVRIMR